MQKLTNDHVRPTLRHRHLPDGNHQLPRRLNKAFTIEIDVLLSMTGQAPLNQALPPRSLRSFGRMSVNRSKDCTGGAGRTVGGRTPQIVHGLRQRLIDPVGEHRLEGRSAGGGGGSFSFALTKACVMPAVSGGETVRAASRNRRWRHRWRGGCTLHRTIVWYGFHPCRCNGHRRRQWRRSERRAPAGSVAPLCAKAMVRAESNSRVSFP